MFEYSKNDANLKIPVRPTRSATKIVFKTPARCNHKYLNSPFYKGTRLWDTLDNNVQRARNLDEFVRHVRPDYSTYKNLFE